MGRRSIINQQCRGGHSVEIGKTQDCTPVNGRIAGVGIVPPEGCGSRKRDAGSDISSEVGRDVGAGEIVAAGSGGENPAAEDGAVVDFDLAYGLVRGGEVERGILNGENGTRCGDRGSRSESESSACDGCREAVGIICAVERERAVAVFHEADSATTCNLARGIRERSGERHVGAGGVDPEGRASEEAARGAVRGNEVSDEGGDPALGKALHAGVVRTHGKDAVLVDRDVAAVPFGVIIRIERHRVLELEFCVG